MTNTDVRFSHIFAYITSLGPPAKAPFKSTCVTAAQWADAGK